MNSNKNKLNSKISWQKKAIQTQSQYIYIYIFFFFEKILTFSTTQRINDTTNGIKTNKVLNESRFAKQTYRDHLIQKKNSYRAH